MPTKLTLLGATGSIGQQTLSIVREREDNEIYALTAHTNVDKLFEQCVEFRPQVAVIGQETAASRLQGQLKAASRLQGQLKAAGLHTEVLVGEAGLDTVATASEVDCVVAGIMGGAGLRPTYEACRHGKRVLLANKEPLVMAGQLFIDTIVASGATLVPVDSEHSGVFQCLPEDFRVGVPIQEDLHITLTASGGPFLKTPLEQLHTVTPAQACAHPNWQMGQKISVDSATMMNKGLELVEAYWLFNQNADKLSVMVHPESILHATVGYPDGSVLAHMGMPDMRTPIAYGLSWPARIQTAVAPLDLAALGQLSFRELDRVRFPLFALAEQALAAGSIATIVLNAANEIAVEAFLKSQIGFMAIRGIIETCLTQCAGGKAACLEAILAVDSEARRVAKAVVAHESGVSVSC